MSANNRDVLRALGELWGTVPEQRFGQLVMNISREPDGFADTWEWSNDVWIERIVKTYSEWKENP